MKTNVLPSSGKDLSMIDTNLRILGTLFTDLRGLMTLNILRTFSEGISLS